MRALATVMKLELIAARRNIGRVTPVVVFYALTIMLMPFALGPDPSLLQRLAPGLIWLAALLACLFAADRLFVRDAQEGELDLLRLAAIPLPLLVAARSLMHWLISAGPLIILAPAMMLVLNLPLQHAGIVMASLACGSLILTLLGTLAGVLTSGARASLHGAGLVAVLVMPLFIPALIAGVSAIELGMQGENFRAPLLLLAAMACASLVIMPLLIAASLRHFTDQS